MKDKISVIVPIYNAAAYLEKCLDSLRVQTYEALQILLIDDGSTDGSADICRRYTAEDRRFQYIYQENRGVSAARNAGLALAEGEFVGFCDSDDWVEPDFFAALHTLARENGADISIVSFVREDGTGPELVPADDPTVHTFDGRGAILEMHRGGLFAGHLCNKLVRRSLLEGLRLREDIVIFEDMLIMWDLFFRAEKVVFQKLHRYHYFFNPRSALRGGFRDSLWSGLQAVQELHEKMHTHFPGDIAYADRTILFDCYWFAEKLAIAGKLTKGHYARLETLFREHGSEAAIGFFDRRQKLKFRIFLSGRGLFLLYMGIVKGYRRLKLRLGDLRKKNHE